METPCVVYKIHPKNKRHPISAHTANQRMMEEWTPMIGKTVFMEIESAKAALKEGKCKACD